jgi:hypothetical protein
LLRIINCKLSIKKEQPPGCLLALGDLKLTVPPEPVIPESVPLTTPLQVRKIRDQANIYPANLQLVMSLSSFLIRPVGGKKN